MHGRPWRHRPAADQSIAGAAGMQATGAGRHHRRCSSSWRSCGPSRSSWWMAATAMPITMNMKPTRIRFPRIPTPPLASVGAEAVVQWRNGGSGGVALRCRRSSARSALGVGVAWRVKAKAGKDGCGRMSLLEALDGAFNRPAAICDPFDVMVLSVLILIADTKDHQTSSLCVIDGRLQAPAPAHWVEFDMQAPMR